MGIGDLVAACRCLCARMRSRISRTFCISAFCAGGAWDFGAVSTASEGHPRPRSCRTLCDPIADCRNLRGRKFSTRRHRARGSTVVKRTCGRAYQALRLLIEQRFRELMIDMPHLQPWHCRHCCSRIGATVGLKIDLRRQREVRVATAPSMTPYTNLVIPGSARGATGRLPFQSTVSGKSFSCEFSA